MRFADIWNLVDSAFADIARMIDAKSNWQPSESARHYTQLDKQRHEPAKRWPIRSPT